MRFSPSSLAQYKLCPRRWALRKLAKLKEKEKRGTSMGTEVHLALERYGKRESLAGISPEAIRCAQPGLKMIQKELEQGLESLEEHEFEFMFEGNEYGGKIDRIVLFSDRVLVRDWKSLKDFGYALNEAELLDDEQGTIYAMAAYEAGADRVTDQWVYLCTQKPDIRIVQVEQQKERVLRRLTVINEQATEMKNLSEQLAPGEFTANIGACHSYGQLCSYHMANGGPCNPFGETKEVSMASLADRIKAKKLTPEMLGMDDEQAQKPVAALVPEKTETYIDTGGSVAALREPAPVSLTPAQTVVAAPVAKPLEVVAEEAASEAQSAQVLDAGGKVLADVGESKKTRGRPAKDVTAALTGMLDLAVKTKSEHSLGCVTLIVGDIHVAVS
jgi:CRISPR/Cas system-associated exonuclease Cas4 (RecB family)